MILYFSKKTGRCIGTLHGRVHTEEQKTRILVQPQDHTTDEIDVVINEWKPVGTDEKGNTIFEPEWGDPVFWKGIEEGTKHIQDLSLVTVDGVKGIQYTPPIDNQATKEVE